MQLTAINNLFSACYKPWIYRCLPPMMHDDQLRKSEKDSTLEHSIFAASNTKNIE